MADDTTALTTLRLRLVPATSAMIEAELEGHERLEEVLAAKLAPDWPPEHHDVDMLRFWRGALLQPGAGGWWLHYALLTDTSGPTLIGSVGYKGPPADGVVEIGYSIVPSCQRQGLATEASRRLIETAWERGAEIVIAHTLSCLKPSIGVLRKLGFSSSQAPEPGVLAFTLRRG